jgi:hypothetical protein
LRRVASDDVTLEALGIRLADHSAEERLRAQLIPVARRIVNTQRAVVGLLPASDHVGVPGLGVQLGLAIAEVTGATAAFVDANVRWPAISEIAVGTRPDDDESMFATRWLGATLALLTPPRAGAAGAGLPQLARVIQRAGEIFAFLLVDLTGFKKIGEHLAAIEMMDGVVVVARAGLTREDELLRLNHELPGHENLGVLITGAD